MAARSTTLKVISGATPRATFVASAKSSKPKVGLRAWMERVLEECDRAAAGFEADPVHDLRVALRRCRSLADGLIALDSDPSWREMKKAGRKLFRALGELRDMQVMQEWIEKLGSSDKDDKDTEKAAGDPVAQKLLAYLHARAAECKQLAWKDLNQFDRKHWRQWGRTLPRRATRVRPGSIVYQHLALEKWTAAYELHKRAMRTRSQVALHELRIGIKRFRYTVENFLPQQHARWGDDLKELQDLLGDVHDLDVLWATALAVQAFPDTVPNNESRRRWRERLNHERNRRIERYREKMIGKESLWRAWRAELPSGPQLRAAAMSRLRVWAAYLDPDFAHSQRVAQLTLQLHEGLVRAGLLGGNSSPETRDVLQAAALLHDVGKAKGQGGHQKKSYSMIRKLARPLGWSARELELVAVVARYHRGALPRPQGTAMQGLDLPDRHLAMQLAGVLRLANGLDRRNGTAPKLEVELRDGVLRVQSAGYSAFDRSAEEVAAARHLLETVLRLPVIVKALRPARTRTQVAIRGLSIAAQRDSGAE